MIQKILGIVLLIGGLYFGYSGYQQLQESTHSAEILGIELKANDQSGQQAGIIQLVIAAVLFGGGIYVVRKA
jgi:hypothetical protein